jgi:hypothetical protein
MKRLAYLIIPAMLHAMIGLGGCDNNTLQIDEQVVNITLRDKDTITIQNYIQGKWKLIYGEGGFVSGLIHHFDNCTAEFTAGNQYITGRTGAGQDTSGYYWEKCALYAGSSDSVYVMFPRMLLFEEIKDDTLIYSDAPMLMSEPVTYYLIKVEN